LRPYRIHNSTKSLYNQISNPKFGHNRIEIRAYSTGETFRPKKDKVDKPEKGGNAEDTKDKTNVEVKTSGSEKAETTIWEDHPDFGITNFSQLPHPSFGTNQHIRIAGDFKEVLRQILWQFKAPIRYAFAYGSGVFSQSGNKSLTSSSLSPHPNPPEAVTKWQRNGSKMIDFIFGVSYTQHWHSLNLQQHPDHYSGLRNLGSYSVAKIQDAIGSGVYFNPYITVNGVMIKYGVVNLSTICQDLSEWQTLYLAGRLQKPVKILRDDPRVRLANQINLISAVRLALLMLPETFSENQLYSTITSLSYMGDPRMTYGSESSSKIRNIVENQLPNFRQLYVPLIEALPSVSFDDPHVPKDVDWQMEEVMARTSLDGKLSDISGHSLSGFRIQQDMTPQRRANMIRRLPPAFRRKIYLAYRTKLSPSPSEFDTVMQQCKDEELSFDHDHVGSGKVEAAHFGKRTGGAFEREIAVDKNIKRVLEDCVRKTISWPSTSQSIKGVFTAGIGKSWRYWSEKRQKFNQSK